MFLFKNKIVMSSFKLTISRVVGVALQALIIVYLAHVLSIKEMGYFSVLYAILGVIRFLGSIGTDQVSLKKISKEKIAVKSLKALQCSKSSFIVSIFSSIIVFNVVIFAQYVYDFSFFKINFIYIAILFPAYILIGQFVAQIRAYGYNLSAQIPEAVVIHLFFGLFLLFVHYNNLINFQNVIICLCVSSLVVLCIYVYIYRRIDIVWPSGLQKGSVSKILKEGFSYFQALTVTAVSARAPLFLATFLLGPSAVAIIDVAFRFGSLSTIVTTSVGSTYSPIYSRLYHQKNILEIKKMLRLASISAGIPALIWSLLIVIFFSTLIQLAFPESYNDSYYPMIIISLSFTISAFMSPASNLLLMSGMENIVKLFTIIQIFLIIGMSFFLIQFFSIEGICFSMLIGSIFKDFGLMYYVIRSLKLNQI